MMELNKRHKSFGAMSRERNPGCKGTRGWKIDEKRDRGD